jgi:hypothetical protein
VVAREVFNSYIIAGVMERLISELCLPQFEQYCDITQNRGVRSRRGTRVEETRAGSVTMPVRI